MKLTSILEVVYIFGLVHNPFLCRGPGRGLVVEVARLTQQSEFESIGSEFLKFLTKESASIKMPPRASSDWSRLVTCSFVKTLKHKDVAYSKKICTSSVS
jgi:hypothetical protein